MSLIFVDCEAFGGCPRLGQLTEFGAVAYPNKEVFYRAFTENMTSEECAKIFSDFESWLMQPDFKGRPIMVSDNPAFDFQWINDGFLRYLGRNPFGHSARRISDFYAGLRGNFYKTQEWKRLRVTPHDHNPVNDAMGNVEAFERLLAGER